jgi:[pyruvate, water dikinase]-phosphate phosphotransferase / [pyruvate, water dikinase] kinase
VDSNAFCPDPGSRDPLAGDLIHLCQHVPVNRVEHPKNYFHLHLISDSTGETLMAAGRAASAQFQDAQVLEHVYPLIRNAKQLAAVLDAIDGAPGIVLYTVVDPDLSGVIDQRCKEMGVPCVSVLEPVINVFQSYLGAPSKRRVGAQHVMDAEYFRRIDALNYTMDHDDGQVITDYEEADIVLVGISRTSKTPTSIYLANRGIKTANVPIVNGVPLPAVLEHAKKPLVVGLVASTDRIAQVRQNRVLGNSQNFSSEIYADRAAISEELKFARSLCLRHNWPMIDVTRKSIEETAAAILALRGRAR